MEECGVTVESEGVCALMACVAVLGTDALFVLFLICEARS